ncbi:hypothetical protein AAMO2058_000272600 [Amorphochlora amoebiformis]
MIGGGQLQSAFVNRKVKFSENFVGFQEANKGLGCRLVGGVVAMSANRLYRSLPAFFLLFAAFIVLCTHPKERLLGESKGYQPTAEQKYKGGTQMGGMNMLRNMFKNRWKGAANKKLWQSKAQQAKEFRKKIKQTLLKKKAQGASPRELKELAEKLKRKRKIMPIPNHWSWTACVLLWVGGVAYLQFFV